MSKGDGPFFVVRNGLVWACWLDGKAAVKIGPDHPVRTAMAEFLDQAAAIQPPTPVPLIEPELADEQAEDSVTQTLSLPLPPLQPLPHATRSNGIRLGPTIRVANQRGNTRHDLTIIGKVYVAGAAWEVTIFDLSEGGCRFSSRDRRLVADAPLSIKLGPIGPIEAFVRWCRGGEVGVEFKVALYPAVLDHVRQHFNQRR